ncbi:uncharacterized protein L969DRAFT_94247 [Mixia osmundae IAM 14324]|uniref:uncharacterized protein n=1 Tax=Mixia osmundae (strain CBS 9802 / IAM 14324 / JCM 22182 / KY 12970) TaxID=764103 RepID=UPI0004A5497C|nr:uncharacterized protein L969DRAFT_94247 [Mixia osmundae IAM 14324]KEI39169.1 hypothetical protein L969DRAFT_94247 [Mixia osmundae IAM 14324]
MLSARSDCATHARHRVVLPGKGPQSKMDVIPTSNGDSKPRPAEESDDDWDAVNDDLLAPEALPESAALARRRKRAERSSLRLRGIISLADLSVMQVIFVALLFISLYHLAALWLFTRGFLLTRATLDERSHCSPDQECTLTPRYSRAIVLIVDALRWDYVFPRTETDGSSPPYSADHHNVLTTPARLSQQQPANSLIFRFVADPPTTTLQRLKGLTTGSLPTFVDAGSNFAAGAVQEDSWIEQAHAARKKIAFAGDDTWMQVFPPAYFAKGMTWPYDSFDVADLDTVDRGVEKHLFDLLAPDSNGSSWDIFVGHSLGLDHAGHRFGSQHPELTRKLREAEATLARVVPLLRADDLLVVLGDHGMDPKGDHGGDSPDEVNAALWMYSPKGLTTVPPHPGKARPMTELLHDTTRSEERTFGLDEHTYRSIPQTDLVPSLSLLLGLPIPFGSLGSIVPELFLWPTQQHRWAKADDSLSMLRKAVRINLRQIMTYLETYARTHSRSSDIAPALPALRTLYSAAMESLDGTDSISLDSYFRFTRSTLTHCKSVWARFNAATMTAGLLALVCSIVMITRLVQTARYEGALFRDGHCRQLIGSAFIAFIATFAIITLPAIVVVGTNTHPDWYAPLVLPAIVVSPVLAIIVYELRYRLPAPSKLITPASLTSWSPVFVLPLAHAAMFASNSFILWEDGATTMLLQSALIMLAIRSIGHVTAPFRRRGLAFALVAAILVRLLACSRLCREEQAGVCSTTFYVSNASSTSAVEAVIAMVPIAMAIPVFVGRFLSITGSQREFAGIFLDGPCRAAWLLASAHNVVDWRAAHSKSPAVMTTVKNYAAIAVICLIIGGGGPLWFFSRLPLTIQEEPATDNTPAKITVLGFANAYGSSYVLLVTILTSWLVLVSPAMGQLALSGAMIASLCMLETLDTARDSDSMRLSLEAKSVDRPLELDWHIGLFALLAQATFFATGHQATLSSIQWNSAFVGTRRLIYPLSPLLVVLNTFSGHILMSLGLPLLVLWKTAPAMGGRPLPLQRKLLITLLLFSLYHAIVALSAAAFAAYFRRHLMVWKVFAPRFMLSGMTLLVIDLTLAFLSTLYGAGTVFNKVYTMFHTARSTFDIAVVDAELSRHCLSAAMRVLVTNDDGPPGKDSPFVLGFVECLRQTLGWEVSVVLPGSQRSWVGAAHSISDIIEGSYYQPAPAGSSVDRSRGEGSRRSTTPIESSKTNANEQDWILLSGTPATCANIALHNIHETIDLVVSGPNFGRNTSTAFALSSGTIGAALASSLSGVPSIAISYAIFERPIQDDQVAAAHDWACVVIKRLWDTWQHDGDHDLYSVNIPLVPSITDKEATKIRFTTMALTRYKRLFAPTAHPSESKAAYEAEYSDTANAGPGALEEPSNPSKVTADRSKKLAFKFAPHIGQLINPPASALQSGHDNHALHHGCIAVTPLKASFLGADPPSAIKQHDEGPGKGHWKL